MKRRDRIEFHRLKDAKRPPLVQRFLTHGRFRCYGGAWLPVHHRKKIDQFRRENPNVAGVAFYPTYPWSSRFFKSMDRDLIGLYVSVTTGRGRHRVTQSGDVNSLNQFQRAKVLETKPGLVSIDIDDLRSLEIRLQAGQIYEVYVQSQAYWGWNFGGQKNIVFHGFSSSVVSTVGELGRWPSRSRN